MASAGVKAEKFDKQRIGAHVCQQGPSAVSAQDCAGRDQDNFRKGCRFNGACKSVRKIGQEADLSREFFSVSMGHL
jgi:hypothetical protein